MNNDSPLFRSYNYCRFRKGVFVKYDFIKNMNIKNIFGKYALGENNLQIDKNFI